VTEGSYRRLEALSAPQIDRLVGAGSILCLPIGAFEQHGAHLPLATDTIIAQRVCDALLDRFGEEFDLWLLPALPFGYSPEHAELPGCIALDLDTFVALIRSVCRSLISATRARRLLVVNGHAGNQPLLTALAFEIQATGFAIAITRPLALANTPTGSSTPDVHGGAGETAIMLATAPEYVYTDLIDEQDATDPEQRDVITDTFTAPGVTWPWSSADPAVSTSGIIGQPHLASPELGAQIIEAAVAGHRATLTRLRNGR
jgi:creatinine amidohydrolase